MNRNRLYLLFVLVTVAVFYPLSGHCQGHKKGDGIFNWKKYKHRYSDLLVKYQVEVNERTQAEDRVRKQEETIKFLKGPTGTSGLGKDKTRQARPELKNISIPPDVQAVIDKMQDEQFEYTTIMKQYKSKAIRYDSIYEFYFKKNVTSLENVLKPLGIDFYTDGRMVTFINLTNDVFLFETGVYTIDEKKVKQEKLQPIVKFLKDKKIQFMVEGNADIDYFERAGCPRNNWDLSSLRATSVVSYLQRNYGIDSTLMTATGRGSAHSNTFSRNMTDEERRKENDRRVNIIIYPDLTELYKLLREEEMRQIKTK